MKGYEKRIKEILNPGISYQIPAYQRGYQWESERWQDLIQDVVSVATNSTNKSHWMGISLLTDDENSFYPNDGSATRYSVIDGQQRLVTILIWLNALIHHAQDNQIKISISPNFSNFYVQNSDKDALEVVLKQEWLNSQHSYLMNHKILRAYVYFRFLLWLGEEFLLSEIPIKVPKWDEEIYNTSIKEYWKKYTSKSAWKRLNSPPSELELDCEELLLATLNKLNIYLLEHQPALDEDQAVVFETLNALQTPLQPLDLVRNSLFVRLESNLSKDIYDNYWKPAETKLLNLPKREFNPGVSFLYDFVIAQGEKKRQGTINKTKGAVHFKNMAYRETNGFKQEMLANYFKNEVVPAMHSWPLIVRNQSELKIGAKKIIFSENNLKTIENIRDLSENPLNPLILLYLTARVKNELSDEELNKFLALIENFAARKILSGIPLSPLRSEVMQIMSSIDKKIDINILRRELRNNWISDKEIKKDFEERSFDSISAKAKAAIFRGIEKFRSGAGAYHFRIGRLEFQIEHIFPNSSIVWKNDSEFINWGTTINRMEKYSQTLGNLAVVWYKHNQEVGNKTFSEKIKYPRKDSGAVPLSINRDWENQSKWTEEEIKTRSKLLIDDALKYWHSDI